MEITKHQKNSALIGPRASFGLACLEAKKTFQDLTIFTADTYTSAGLLRFKKKFPEDIVEVSIAEQVLVSSAAGYALSGGKVIATTFAPFITMRAYEMIRHNLGYMNSPVLLVGLAAGVAFGQLGYTHCCIEDVSIISSIPGIDIYSPIDAGLINIVLEEILRNNTPSYLRITGEPALKPIPINKPIANAINKTGAEAKIICQKAICNMSIFPSKVIDLYRHKCTCKRTNCHGPSVYKNK